MHRLACRWAPVRPPKCDLKVSLLAGVVGLAAPAWGQVGLGLRAPEAGAKGAGCKDVCAERWGQRAFVVQPGHRRSLSGKKG